MRFVIGLVRAAAFLTVISALVAAASAQQSTQTQTQQASDQSQSIPDAPSAVQPPPVPVPKPDTKPTPTPTQVPPPANQAPPGSNADQNAAPGNPPPFQVTTMPSSQNPPAPGAQEQIYKIVANVNQVIVPVTVKDDSGRMVEGLLSKDFSVYENGKKETLNFFTSDPFALSAAVVIDLNMADVALQKVNKTYSALQGAFSQYDEISVYVYGTTVGRVTDFTGNGNRLTAALGDLSTKRGDNNGPPVTGGPMGPQGPTVNNIPVDSPTTPVITPPRTASVLNDAILTAAMDLSKRDKARRKIIFVISDGKELRSQASYQDVLKVLLSNGIMVYGIAVEGAAIPLYGKLERLHLPWQGYNDILPKYANATGGEVFNEFSRNSIENVYAQVIGDARNQYTLGYVTRATPSSSYRQIEVRVANHGASCKSSMRPCVDVVAKDGYYPLPVGR